MAGSSEWGCDVCGCRITLHITPSEPPRHRCGGSARAERFTELREVITTTQQQKGNK